MLLQGLVEAAGRNSVPAPQPPPPDLSTLANDEFVTRAHLTQAQNQALAQVNPWLQTVADQQATMSYNLAKGQEQAFFQKYEPEIVQVLNQVPRHQWTLDVIKKAVTFVKGSHVDEIAADKVRQLESTYESTLRSTGRAGGIQESTRQETTEQSLEKLPKQWRDRASAAGITADTVREYCQHHDLTIDEFFKQFGGGLVTDSVADVSFDRRSA